MNIFLIPLGLSYFIFLIALIGVTLTENRKIRLWIKALTCLHYLAIAGLAILEKGLQASESWLILGLVLCFAGDLALGLKHMSKRYLVAGFVLFGVGLLAYALSFGFRIEAFWIGLPLLVLVNLFVIRVKGSPDYDFNGLGKPSLTYGLIMTVMVSCALGAWAKDPQNISLVRALGALCLFGSDFILLHLYFYKDKKTGFILGYLVLYHLGQSLIALSLWI